MALTAKQRNALPDSAFAYPSKRAYPVPTKAQARKAGISERQRLAIHRNALSRAAQAGTSGSKAHVDRVVARRHGGAIASVNKRKAARRARGGRRRR